MINAVIGYGTDPKVLSKDITTGRYGLLGVYNSFLVLVQDHGIEAALLEGKLSTVIDAAITRVRRKVKPKEEDAYDEVVELWGQGAWRDKKDMKGKKKAMDEGNRKAGEDNVLPEGTKRIRRPTKKPGM
ncbi:hypothetical protein FRC06_008159 [Ceratobasidium sp. 370]|nr:hypothetical protein FRC06_008159 [Ceratobasidium sp. 370]